MNDLIFKYETSPSLGGNPFAGVSMGFNIYPGQTAANHQGQHLILHPQPIPDRAQTPTTGRGILHPGRRGKSSSPAPLLPPPSARSKTTHSSRSQPFPTPSVLRATYTSEVTTIEEPYPYAPSSHSRELLSHRNRESSRRTRSRGETIVHGGDRIRQVDLGKDAYHLATLGDRDAAWKLYVQRASGRDSEPEDGSERRGREGRGGYRERSEESYWSHIDIRQHPALLERSSSGNDYPVHERGYEVHRVEQSGNDREDGGHRWWSRRVLRTEREFQEVGR